jgi:Cu-Zn family superoxide dismutase
MNKRSRCATALAAGIALTGAVVVISSAASANNPAIHARADITGPNGVSGFATFAEDAVGVVHVNIKVTGLTPGEHGTHIHRVGLCEGPTFATAMSHFDPGGAPHGEHTRGEHAGHHAGDLPNLVVNDDGKGRLNTASAHFTLSRGVVESLFDPDGSAIIVHANPDDYVTQATGNSGGRIACGLITEV